MPEGDTIFRTARTLHRALAGKVVARFDSVFPALTRIADDRPIVGRRIESVTARGKHVLIAFSGDLTLHTHMRMNGSWHIYRAGEKWQRPLRDMRIVVGTEDFVAVGFNVPIAALLTGRELARHEQLRSLGPDLLAPGSAAPDIAPSTASPNTAAPNTAAPNTAAPVEIVRRMRMHDRDAIADVVLNQRVLAGIGNVLKSEILFVAAIHPFRAVASLSDDELIRVIATARELLQANVMSRAQTLSPSIGRRTTRSLDPNAKLWVYSRGGRPCRRCGARIESRKTGLDARLTYWCPRCQS
jgi:endonuclease-8